MDFIDATASGNSLGLDLHGLAIGDDKPTTTDSAPADNASSNDDPDDSMKEATDKHGDSNGKKAEKKKPYVNVDRYLTGSNPRDKPSDEELADRMTRIREQNEKIKQRRLDVQADVEAFKKTQEVERAKEARTRKLQENVDQAREHNARRKMDKIEAREWDSGKQGDEWSAGGGQESPDEGSEPDRLWQPPRSAGRASGSRGRGRQDRGRGGQDRGRGGRDRGRARGGRGRGRGTPDVETNASTEGRATATTTATETEAENWGPADGASWGNEGGAGDAGDAGDWGAADGATW